MRKLLFTLCALLSLGVSEAWADDITWESTDATKGDINCYGFGITLPDETVDNKAYNVSSFTIQLRGTTSNYMAIATEPASSANFSSSKVIAVSTNKNKTSDTSFEYSFKGLALFKGVTYYVHFFSENTPTDGLYSENQQGIKVGTTSTSYDPGMVLVGGSYTIKRDGWPPIFSATLNEGMLISPSTGNYNSTGTYASKWTSGCKAPSLQLSTTANNTRIADGAIFSGGSSCTYTISVASGYLITGYKIKGQALVADKDQTITPVDGSGNPVVFTSSAENIVDISDIEKASTTFTLAGENNGMSISEFRVYVKRDPSITTLVSTLKTNMETYKDLSGVGYPKSTATERINLNSAYSEIDSYTGSTEDDIKCINYAGQLEAYNNYLTCTDIEMPVDGKVYTFTNIAAAGTNEYYIRSSGGTMTAETNEANATSFICHQISTNQFAFISLNDWYWMITASSKNATVSMTYDEFAPITISNFYSNYNASNTSSATPANTFGLVQLYGERKLSNGSMGTAGNKGNVMIVNDNATHDFNVAGSAFFKTTLSSAYKITEVSDYYNKVKLTSDGTDAYASVYLPFSVTIPSGVTAYAVTSQNGTYATMGTIVTDGTLPKETAAILKKAGQTETETIYLSPATETGSYTGDNLLGGTVDEEQTPPAGTNYVLGNADGFIGLYPYTGTYLARGKAYLNIPASVKMLTFNFGDVDAISSLNEEESSNENREFLDLSGRRVNNPTRGLYIVRSTQCGASHLKNGKKVIVK